MQAIILAGGRGTRISEIVPDVPKPMIPMAGRPFLEILIEYINSQGVEHFYLSIGHLSEIIVNHFSQHKYKDKIDFNIEKELLGTGGAIHDTIKQLKINNYLDNILVLNGDSFNLFDAKKFFEHHINNDNDITILTKKMINVSRYGRVITEGDLVIGFEEKGSDVPGKINAGIYVMKTNLFERFNLGNKFSFETDLLQKHICNLKVGYFDSFEYFIDFGIPEDYYKAVAELPTLIAEN